MPFKKNFVWGTATASYQVEGAAEEDGKGASIWDMITRKKDFIFENQNGNTACDSYHRYKEDVSLMKKIGANAYRFSVSWPRVLPDGFGRVNEKGLDYYDRLVNELVENGVEPYVTLYHWDMPYEIYKRGGWLSPETPKYFGEYAEKVVKRLSDRVTNWFTINEPQCVIGAGYMNGDHAPALRVSEQEGLLGIHNTLLAHGRAAAVIRANAAKKPRIGFAPVGSICHPLRAVPECIKAAYDETFAASRDPWWSNTAWSEPIINGEYPEDMLKNYGHIMPKYTADEMKLINTGLDFYAFNTYQSAGVDVDEDGRTYRAKRKDGFARTAMNWSVEESCLYWGAKFFYEKYHLPIIISENGMSSHDWICLDGKVHDSYRSDYIMRHIGNLMRAADEGVDIDGYFLWSLVDNFEWRGGYNQRFGIVYVDFATKKRTMKDSAFVYSDIIETNGEILRKKY